MFGFKDSKSVRPVARQRDDMRDAQAAWPFLTIYDLATVTNAAELAEMIQARSSISAEEATRQVQAWMQGKTA